MDNRCGCGSPIVYAFELGCIECGRDCCPVCGIALESAIYCADCGTALVDASADTSQQS
jgi:hypothetical protein